MKNERDPCSIFFLNTLILFLAFHKKILQTLIAVKLQNEQILNRLNERDANSVQSLLPELPIEIPLKTVDELTTLETYFKEKNNLNNLVSIPSFSVKIYGLKYCIPHIKLLSILKIGFNL